MRRQSLLEKIVEERVGQTDVGTVSVAVERVAEAIAREALADDTFRRLRRELVRLRSRELLDELLRNGARTNRPTARPRPRRRRR